METTETKGVFCASGDISHNGSQTLSTLAPTSKKPFAGQDNTTVLDNPANSLNRNLTDNYVNQNDGEKNTLSQTRRVVMPIESEPKGHWTINDLKGYAESSPAAHPSSKPAGRKLQMDDSSVLAENEAGLPDISSLSICRENTTEANPLVVDRHQKGQSDSTTPIPNKIVSEIEESFHSIAGLANMAAITDKLKMVQREKLQDLSFQKVLDVVLGFGNTTPDRKIKLILALIQLGGNVDQAVIKKLKGALEQLILNDSVYILDSISLLKKYLPTENQSDISIDLSSINLGLVEFKRFSSLIEGDSNSEEDLQRFGDILISLTSSSELKKPDWLLKLKLPSECLRQTLINILKHYPTGSNIRYMNDLIRKGATVTEEMKEQFRKRLDCLVLDDTNAAKFMLERFESIGCFPIEYLNKVLFNVLNKSYPDEYASKLVKYLIEKGANVENINEKQASFFGGMLIYLISSKEFKFAINMLSKLTIPVKYLNQALLDSSQTEPGNTSSQLIISLIKKGGAITEKVEKNLVRYLTNSRVDTLIMTMNALKQHISSDCLSNALYSISCKGMYTEDIIDSLTILIDSGVVVTEKISNYFGMKLSHYVSCNHDNELSVKLVTLLKGSIPIEYLNEALCYAAGNGQIDLIESLIDAGANVNEASIDTGYILNTGYRMAGPIAFAVKEGRAEAVRLLCHYADKIIVKNQVNPLIMCIETDDTYPPQFPTDNPEVNKQTVQETILAYLLSELKNRKEDYAPVSKEIGNPFALAIANNKPNMVRMFLEYGGGINEYNPYNRCSALTSATRIQNNDMLIRVILEHAIDNPSKYYDMLDQQSSTVLNPIDFIDKLFNDLFKTTGKSGFVLANCKSDPVADSHNRGRAGTSESFKETAQETVQVSRNSMDDLKRAVQGLNKHFLNDRNLTGQYCLNHIYDWLSDCNSEQEVEFLCQKAFKYVEDQTELDYSKIATRLLNDKPPYLTQYRDIFIKLFVEFHSRHEMIDVLGIPEVQNIIFKSGNIDIINNVLSMDINLYPVSIEFLLESSLDENTVTDFLEKFIGKMPDNETFKRNITKILLKCLPDAESKQYKGVSKWITERLSDAPIEFFKCRDLICIFQSENDLFIKSTVDKYINAKSEGNKNDILNLFNDFVIQYRARPSNFKHGESIFKRLISEMASFSSEMLERLFFRSGSEESTELEFKIYLDQVKKEAEFCKDKIIQRLTNLLVDVLSLCKMPQGLAEYGLIEKLIAEGVTVTQDHLENCQLTGQQRNVFIRLLKGYLTQNPEEQYGGFLNSMFEKCVSQGMPIPMDVVRILLNHNVPILDFTNKQGRTLLHWVAMQPYDESASTIKALCSLGADPRLPDGFCRTPLHHVANWTHDAGPYLYVPASSMNNNQVNAVNTLLEMCKCDHTILNYQDKNGQTPLALAYFKHSNPQVASLLVSKVNNGNSTTLQPSPEPKEERESVINQNGEIEPKRQKVQHLPVARNNDSTSEKNTILQDVMDNYGNLTGFRKTYSSELIKILIANGADIHRESKSGWPIWLEAVFIRDSDLIKWIINRDEFTVNHLNQKYSGLENKDLLTFIVIFHDWFPDWKTLAECMVEKMLKDEEVSNEGSLLQSVIDRIENIKLEARLSVRQQEELTKIYKEKLGNARARAEANRMCLSD